MDSASSAERLPVETPGWPASHGERIVFLLDASSALERRLLEGWIDSSRPSGDAPPHDVVAIPPSRRSKGRREPDPRLEASLAGGGDPIFAPLRVAWEREKIPGKRENPVKELLTVGDPRDPGRLRQEWILRRHPERCRIVAAEVAHASELRERWRDACGVDVGHTIGLAEFVSRQAALALERAERRMRGARYKVPRLVHENILSRPAVRGGLAQLARELGEPEAKVAERASEYLKEIAATHSPHVIDLAAHLIHSLYTRGYGESLRYDRRRLEEIYALTQRYPVVFLPSHKSNFDHLVLQYALHENGHPPNHTAGGINMNFFPVGPIVRRSGVFFIRRTFKDNPLYKFVLRQYVDYLVEKRFSLEWYVEGGRSRSGKLLPPRLGLLAYVVDAFRRGHAEDVYLIPVSIAYDQIQDVGDYVAEQRGAAKKKESFGWFVAMLRSIRKRFGNIHINFGEPLSLREALGPPDPSHGHDPDEESLQLQKVAFEVAARINDVTPITPTSLLTFSLLGVGDKAVTIDEIARSIQNLLDYVTRRGLPTTDGPEHELATREGLERALESLIASEVVTCFREGLEPVYAIGLDQHLTAAYYRNTIIHFFVNAAIVELALLAAAEEGVGDPERELFEQALRLRDLLKFEFFFSPRDEFRGEVVAELDARQPGWQEVLRSGPAEIRAAALRLKPLLAHRVIRPFLEAYQVVAEMLPRATAKGTFDEGAFLGSCVALGKQYQMQRRIRSAESVSKVLFQTALSLARNRGLVPGTGGGTAGSVGAAGAAGTGAGAGADDLEARQRAFADEIRDAVRRIEAIDAIGAARRSGLID